MDDIEKLAIPALSKALADNPEIFSDDPHVAHQAASPHIVDVARLKAHSRAMAALSALSAAGLEVNKAGTREATGYSGQLEFAYTRDGRTLVGFNPRSEEGGWIVAGDVTDAMKAVTAERDRAIEQSKAALKALSIIRTAATLTEGE